MISAPTLVTFATKVTGTAAPRDGKGNMKIWIHIDHNCRAAMFECATAEHVGSHSGRNAVFVADEDCTLHFTDTGPFGVGEIPLKKMGPRPLSVPGSTTNCETGVYVTQDSSAMDADPIQQLEIAPLVSFSPMDPKVPPRIIVP